MAQGRIILMNLLMMEVYIRFFPAGILPNTIPVKIEQHELCIVVNNCSDSVILPLRNYRISPLTSLYPGLRALSVSIP